MTRPDPSPVVTDQDPGLVEPAPWWAVLPSATALEEAAAELREAA